jgi:hypothetical protein
MIIRPCESDAAMVGAQPENGMSACFRFLSLNTFVIIRQIFQMGLVPVFYL